MLTPIKIDNRMNGFLGTPAGAGKKPVVIHLHERYGIVEHTTDLGGTAAIGNVSAFGVDAAGELYIVSHTNGTIIQIMSAAPVPSAPTNLRIIR